jgi:hypothetical protein
MIELLGLALLVCDIPWMNSHLRIGTGGSALGQCARVDDKYAVDNLKCEDMVSRVS